MSRQQLHSPPRPAIYKGRLCDRDGIMKRVDYYREILLQYYADKRKKIGYLASNIAFLISWFSRIYSKNAAIGVWGFLAVFFGGLCILPGNAWAVEIPATQSGLTSDSMDAQIDGLIKGLSSDDAQQREAAGKQLVAIGRPARPAILQATRSTDPELREQAAQILLRLPWFDDSDPQKARDILATYGQVNDETGKNVVDATPENRQDAVRMLASLPDSAGYPAMARLMNEEPNDSVRWIIVGEFRQSDNEQFLERFLSVTPPPDDAPMLALCGYAALPTDLDKGEKLLQQAADLEFINPSDDSGEVDFIVRTLSRIAVLHKDLDHAADLWRKEIDRGSVVDDSGIPTALLELLVLQADYGPIKGLEGDIKLANAAGASPKIDYALAKIAQDAGNPDQANALRQKAFDASSTRAQRYDVGDFLYEHDWNDNAEKEFNAYLKIPPTPASSDGNEVNVNFRLSGLALRRGDNLAAAQFEEQAMLHLSDPNGLTTEDADGHEIPTPSSEIWAEVYWLYLQDANDKHDQAEIDKRLAQLVENKPKNPEIVEYVVPLLKQLHRADEAHGMFQASFDDLKSKLDQDPTSSYELNNIAWLCAECDEQLDAGKKWAEAAVAERPDNPAFIDTLAEVNYKSGHADAAVKLETQALKLAPGDDLMTKQLAKFQAATTQPATMPEN